MEGFVYRKQLAPLLDDQKPSRKGRERQRQPGGYKSYSFGMRDDGCIFPLVSLSFGENGRVIRAADTVSRDAADPMGIPRACRAEEFAGKVAMLHGIGAGQL